jgi:hypothetical protein
MSDRIKVTGYSQKTTYTDGVEYRNFSPDLVGFQVASNGSLPLMTMGNFAITTNADTRLTRQFITSQFSNFVTLSSLDTTVQTAQQLLADNAEVFLNLDKGKLEYYALFGSLREFIRVSLEDIIIKWPASLYLQPFYNLPNQPTTTGYTAQNYVYDSLTETANFRIDTNFIVNNYQINYTTTGNILNSFNETNPLRNFTINYASYSLLIDNEEYPVLAFTASTFEKNDNIYLTIKGNPFSGTETTQPFHIKPNKINVDSFFNSLPDFEYYLLSRDVTPIYTAYFRYPIKTDTGIIVYISNNVTWPVSDGYNIDYDTQDYINYANSLLDIATSNDLYSSNLMNRFLVSESITAFDTTPVHISSVDEDDTGQKINKTLQIYGREYDELNKYIIGIQFANVVSYNKQDNTPDVYVKNLARVLGWDLISSITENNLLTNYVEAGASTYSGQSVGFTPLEADIEMWRRLILNSPWIWKSKGARKSIEFLLKFIGAPQGLMQFNEYIYRAKEPIDMDLFERILKFSNLSQDISTYPVDSDGYPKYFPDNDSMYFQNYGLWYRETAGTGATIDILTGNNPHVGPYDRGSKYINQFRALIPNFSAVTVSSVTTTNSLSNLYVNYDYGTFDEGVSTATTVDTVSIYGVNYGPLEDCVSLVPSIIEDPNPTVILDPCGCPEDEITDNVLSLCIQKDLTLPDSICSNSLASSPIIDNDSGLYVFQQYQYLPNGNIYNDVNGNPVYNTTNYTKQECCRFFGGTPVLVDEYRNNVLINQGYYCCDNSGKCGCTIACGWMVDLQLVYLPPITPNYNGPQDPYLKFIKRDGSNAVVTQDGCNCLKNYTIAVPNILDPYTGEIGYGCQLTGNGMADFALGQNGMIYKNYNFRSTGRSSCYETI